MLASLRDRPPLLIAGFRTDRRTIVAESVDQAGESRLLDLAKSQVAFARALVLGTRSYSSVAAILKNHRENAPPPMAEGPILIHENIRGPGYYH